MIIPFRTLKSFHVHASDDVLGKVKDVLFDDRSYALRYLVVDTARWLPGRLVLLAPTSFESFDLDGKMANTGLSKAQVEESPPLLEDLPVSRQYETELRNYYGWPSYWSHPAGMAFPYPPDLYPVGHPLANETRMPEEWVRILEERRERQDEHLRSADELIGYRIAAKDEDFGEVRDLLLDLDRQRLVDVVLGSRKWLPGGKEAVCSPMFVDRIDYLGRKLAVRLEKDDLLGGPEFSLERYDADYRARLVDHYLERRKASEAGREREEGKEAGSF